MQLYRAVVEDNQDPEKLGRVKVRIWGLHTEYNENSGQDFEFIKTEELPWAEIMGGTDFGLINGVGISTVLRQGTWVWVTLNHDNPNFPIVVGTIIGNVQKRDKFSDGQGFNDKDEVYPYDARNSEPDQNRLARNEKLNDQYYDIEKGYSQKETIHKIISDNVDIQQGKTDSISECDASQEEPVSLNDKSEYPNVNVLETHSGHVIELDDTPTNERIRVYHKTGSYIEIRPDGSFIQKSVADKDADGNDSINHYIHMSEVHEHIAKGVRTYIEKNIDEFIDGGIRRNVQLDFFKHIGGYFKIQADGNLQIINDVKITGNLEVTEKITATDNISSKAEVADFAGNLSSLRDQYDAHEHTNPSTSDGASQAPTTSHPADPRIRWGDYTWTNNPLGFKL